MTNEITSTCDMAEAEWGGDSEPSDVDTDMVATKEAEGRGIEFHVSMRDYTMRDMEALIIEAAAALIVGRRNDREMAKIIEAKCIEKITDKADEALAKVTAEIIDQPVTKDFASASSPPMTMRELIALTGKDYLTTRVGRDGKPITDRFYANQATPRIQLMVEQAMDRKFKAEIEKATNAAINEVRRAIQAEHEALLTAEKHRFRAALDKVTA